MTMRQKLVPTPVPENIKMQTHVWATPTSRVAARPAAPAPPVAITAKQFAKRALRALLPPLAFDALRRLRRPKALAPPEARRDPVATPLNLAYRHALALQARVPELADFHFQITPKNADAILTFFNAYIPIVKPDSRNAYLRTQLARLREAAPDLDKTATLHIARADLADGLPDRAQALRSDPEFSEELERQTVDFETTYGAKVITTTWGDASRGSAILFYLQNHPAYVSGKAVLHIAPESEVRGWLRTICDYTVLDGTPDSGTDIAADVTSIPLSENSFDFILCHRVLEHVMDDQAALREFHRLLRPNGILNMSVPQAVHRDHTVEWLIQDGSHHGHVRQYGKDLPARLERAGFEVKQIDWLIQQSREELLRRGAIPLRMYECRKK